LGVAMEVGKEWLAASGGCCIADGLLNPLEVVKVRLQLQSTGYYPGLVGGLRRAAAEEGVFRGLWWPGLYATWIRAFTTVGFRIGMYPTMKRQLWTRAEEPPLRIKILSGMLSGGIGAAIFCPIEVVRIRMQAEGGRVGRDGRLETGLYAGQRPRYATVLGTFRAILESSGVLRGLWGGAEWTVSRAAVLSGSQLASYDSLKRVAKERGLLEEGPALHMSCSLASGFIAQTCIQPVDTLRSVVMAQRGGDVIPGIRSEGPAYLYRGFIAACCRQGPIMLIQMPLVEGLRGFLGLGPL